MAGVFLLPWLCGPGRPRLPKKKRLPFRAVIFGGGIMEDASLGWMAGVMDGEGTMCIHVIERSSRARLFVSVSNTDYRMISELRRLTGLGSIRREERSERQRARWIWRTAGQKAAAFLEMILPYLRVKKEQAIIALQFANAQRRYGGGGCQKDHRRWAEYQRLRRELRAAVASRVTDMVEVEEVRPSLPTLCFHNRELPE